MVRLLTAWSCFAACACASVPLPVNEPVSIGTTDEGYLHQAISLANRGPGYVRVRPRDDTRYGTTTLVDTIERAARAVVAAFPGGYPLRVGDLSNPRGGAHERHRSHRTGRDADLIFFTRDAGGVAARGADWLPFDQYGVSAHDDGAFVFDDARNWALIRSLVTDLEARVKWIFCSAAVKARLLRYAAVHEPSPEVVLRATWILHEPGRGDPHADHFHVRVGCGEAERALGCREEAPFWPWLDDPARKPVAHAAPSAGDGQLVGWLLAEQRPDQRRDVLGRSIDIAAQPTAIARRDLD